jgi:xylulokinase
MSLAKQAPPGAGGVMFLPHMSGATIPVADSSSMGAFVGLRNVVGKGHMLRAIIEGLNYQLLQILSGMESALGVRADKFVAVGGGVSNSFWMQTKADMVGKPFETPQVEEATPLGAAILAGIGVGLYRDEQDAFQRVYRSGRVYEPDLKLTAQYAERFAAFQRLYPALKDIHATLRKLV